MGGGDGERAEAPRDARRPGFPGSPAPGALGPLPRGRNCSVPSRLLAALEPESCPPKPISRKDAGIGGERRCREAGMERSPPRKVTLGCRLVRRHARPQCHVMEAAESEEREGHHSGRRHGTSRSERAWLGQAGAQASTWPLVGNASSPSPVGSLCPPWGRGVGCGRSVPLPSSSLPPPPPPPPPPPRSSPPPVHSSRRGPLPRQGLGLTGGVFRGMRAMGAANPNPIRGAPLCANW